MVDPGIYLDTVSVLFLGSGDTAHPIDPDTFVKFANAVWDLWETSTFTKETKATDPSAEEGARDGTSLAQFKQMLKDFGRDEIFVETATEALWHFDKQRETHDNEGREGLQIASIEPLLDRLETSSPDQFELLSGGLGPFKTGPLPPDSQGLRDGLRAYCKFALHLELPEQPYEKLRTSDELGENLPSFEEYMKAHPSYKGSDPTVPSAVRAARDDLSRLRTGTTVGGVADLDTPDVDNPDDDTPSGTTRGAGAVDAPVVTVPAPPLSRAYTAAHAAVQLQADKRSWTHRSEREEREWRSMKAIGPIFAEIRVILFDTSVSLNDIRLKLEDYWLDFDGSCEIDGETFELTTTEQYATDKWFRQIVEGGRCIEDARLTFPTIPDEEVEEEEPDEEEPEILPDPETAPPTTP